MTEEEKKEKRQEYQREWYAKNRDRCRKRNSKWRVENREKTQEHRRKVYAANPQHSTISSLFHRAKDRAKDKGLPFILTKEWVAERIEWGKCELSGIPFNLEAGRGVQGQYSPSIDRIVPELGYTPENCRMILCAINFLKLNGTDEDMLNIAKALVKYQGE